MLRVLLILLWLATVEAMDGAFSRPSGSDHREPPQLFKYFPNKHVLWVGGPEFGKSSFLQMRLLWGTSIFCLRKMFKELVIIGRQLAAGMSVEQTVVELVLLLYIRWYFQY